KPDQKWSGFLLSGICEESEPRAQAGRVAPNKKKPDQKWSGFLLSGIYYLIWLIGLSAHCNFTA
ncbi:hypothetical protein, partial [Vibrio furnissii]|uniref:hypothetical protein n=1 Tax=Vibrio furnissii TaxID=29494 RepID=UPI001EEA7FC0|nr:hypothetical protein [Vibrio furnissii]